MLKSVLYIKYEIVYFLEVATGWSEKIRNIKLKSYKNLKIYSKPLCIQNPLKLKCPQNETMINSYTDIKQKA